MRSVTLREVRNATGWFKVQRCEEYRRIILDFQIIGDVHRWYSWPENHPEAQLILKEIG